MIVDLLRCVVAVGYERAVAKVREYTGTGRRGRNKNAKDRSRVGGNHEAGVVSGVMKNQAEHLNRGKIEQVLLHFYRSSLPVLPVVYYKLTGSVARSPESVPSPLEDIVFVPEAEDFGIARAHL